MTTGTTWQVLFVDDDADICRQVKEFLNDETLIGSSDRLIVETVTSFDAALRELETRRFDLLMLDVRQGPYEQQPNEEIGIVTLEKVRQRRFVPVVFYTGLPNLVRHLETPLIRVVEKTQGLSHLLEILSSIFVTGLPLVNRALIRHFEMIQRDYMWNFVSSRWDQFGDTQDRIALAYLLARRLALSLAGSGIHQLASDLGDSTNSTPGQNRIHPMRYYVMPPVEVSPLAGDVYRGRVRDQSGWWILITPSCDMKAGREKAEWVSLAHCMLLTEQTEYQKWSVNPSPATSTKKLQDLIKNNRQDGQRERFFFLPGALYLPDLVVDFQQIIAVPRAEMGSLERIASLDSPFSEALLGRFARYFGRLGTPDLDPDVVIARLLSKINELTS